MNKEQTQEIISISFTFHSLELTVSKRREALGDQLTVSPHHSHLMPAKHSDDQHVFLHARHFELAGRLPSLQW